MKHVRIFFLVLVALATVTCAVWRSFPAAGDSQYLGRDGVFFQHATTDCGGAAIKMIFDRFDIAMEYGLILQRLRPGTKGTTMSSMRELARSAGLLCEGWQLAPCDLFAIPLPAILLLRSRHYVIAETCSDPDRILILDPVRGRFRVSVRRLQAVWNGGSLLFCKPGNCAGPHGRWFARSQSMERRISK